MHRTISVFPVVLNEKTVPVKTPAMCGGRHMDSRNQFRRILAMAQTATRYSFPTLLLLLAGALVTSCAQARQSVDANSSSNNDKPDYQIQNIDNTISVRQRSSNQLLLEEPLQQLAISRVDGSLTPETQIEIVPNGYSIHYSFTNNASSPKPLPDLRVGPILLGDSVTYQDTRHNCQNVDTTAANHKTPGYLYPTNMYSPIWIVRNKNQACGVSLEYPIMQYKHDVKFFMRYHRRSGGWLVDMRISSDNDALLYSAAVPPGQTWQYTVNVRFTPKSDEWVRTLLPYRDFFRSTYGGLQYDRQTCAINATGLSLQQALSDDNPYGFSREKLRPDLYGYGPFVDYVLTRTSWPSQMIINPSGIYHHNIQFNYPFLFTSNWESSPEFETALDPDIGFPRISATGKQLGFWWGRSAQIAYQWDPNQSYPLDPDNTQHQDAAFKELDLAVQAGATVIGMDTFGHRMIPIWEGAKWIDMLKARYPQLHFVLEPMPCDIMHRKAPGWLRGFNDGKRVDSLEELNFIKGPHYLADFLLPGHETWAAWRYKGHRKYLNITPTQEMVDEDVRRFAHWGYRPMIYTEFELTSKVQAAQSWLETVPEDIQLDPNNNSSYGPEEYRADLSNASGSRASNTNIKSQQAGQRAHSANGMTHYGTHVSRNLKISPAEAKRAIRRSQITRDAKRLPKRAHKKKK